MYLKHNKVCDNDDGNDYDMIMMIEYYISQLALLHRLLFANKFIKLVCSKSNRDHSEADDCLKVGCAKLSFNFSRYKAQLVTRIQLCVNTQSGATSKLDVNSLPAPKKIQQPVIPGVFSVISTRKEGS